MIKAGLIGGRLSHSLSPQIHGEYWQKTGLDGQYLLLETEREKLGERLDELAAQGYAGVNVTIPHKTAVMAHLDALSPEAQTIGAVNTVHFSDGRRIGYNTDYFGLQSLLMRHGMVLAQKRVVILGAGGAARCALCLARDEGASDVLVVSRQPQKANASLAAAPYTALEALDAIDVLINTTPVGMYPHFDECPVWDAVIEKSAAVVDLIYNPERTVLLQKAAAFSKPHAGGLWMLCAQALRAEQIWTGQPFDEALCAHIFQMLSSKTNIVLIGMPGSGKSTLGRMIAKRLGYSFADTDTMIEDAHGRITDIFAGQGEAAFRKLELDAAKQAAASTSTVISTGGGIIETAQAMEALRQTGTVVYIDRPLELLLNEVETENRPLLADGRDRLVSLYEKRHSLYTQYADFTAGNACDAQSCADLIIEKLKEKRQ